MQDVESNEDVMADHPPGIIQLRLDPLGRDARSSSVVAAIAELGAVERAVVYSVEPTRIRKRRVGS